MGELGRMFGSLVGKGGGRGGRGPFKSMGRPDGHTATVGLGGSMGLGGIYGAGGVVVGLEGVLWGWRGSYGVAMGHSKGLRGGRLGEAH